MYRIKTFFLMALLTIVFILLGGAIAGEQGLIMAFVIALVLNFIGYWKSDTIAIKMTRSRPLSENEAPELYAMVRKLTQGASMPMPKLYLTPSSQPNAFATGRSPKHAAVAVTAGIMKMLDRRELKGVIAHELAHIRNYDTLISTFATVLAGALAFIARMGQFRMLFGGMRGNRNNGAALALQLVAIILAPIAAMLVRMAISRSREYLADATGARIAGTPDGLASALTKMSRAAERNPMRINEAASHMFIVNPIAGQRFASLFSTHPPLEQRVARLRRIEDKRA